MEAEKKWADMTWQEKREVRFKKWLSPGIKFESPEAKKLYRERVARFIKVLKLEEPDRVPVLLPSGFFPVFNAGMTLMEVMYDYAKMKQAWLKFIREFEMDSFTGPSLVLPGKVFDMVGHKLHKWPGHGLPEDATLYQYIEGVYMSPEEYPDFLDNPNEFWERILQPRFTTAFEPFSKLAPFSGIFGMPTSYLIAMGAPDVQKAYRTMLQAARESVKWFKAIHDVNRIIKAAGFPDLRGGGGGGSPFDMIADVLRGTQGTIIDMFRRPEVLHEAMEKVAPRAIKAAVAAGDATGCPLIFMPLHKGDESFLSPKQFETFYWPGFKKVLLGCINEGLVPYAFAEGRYGARLEVIKEMPKGSMLWSFEDTDMARAKKILGGHSCIAGNVPTSIMYTGTPADVKECCRKLIETCAPGGGYILTGASGLNKGNPGNLRAFMEASREYGVYK